MADPSSPRTRNRFLVIVPAFNERASIGELVRHLRRRLPEFDVLVIDDGSTDGTKHCIADNAYVVTLPFNLGIGGAMQTGYRYAHIHGYELAVQVDGDGQHPPREVRKLVNHLNQSGADMVIGSRFVAGGRYRQSPLRWIGIAFLSRMIGILAGRRIYDCTSGFRVANRRIINAFAHWYPDDYPEPEVVLLLQRGGFRLEEVSVTMRQRRGGRTSIGLFAGVFYVIKVATCLMLDMVRNPWPAEQEAAK